MLLINKKNEAMDILFEETEGIFADFDENHHQIIKLRKYKEQRKLSL
jgi:hypothetical protein